MPFFCKHTRVHTFCDVVSLFLIILTVSVNQISTRCIVYLGNNSSYDLIHSNKHTTQPFIWLTGTKLFISYDLKHWPL